VEQTTSSGFPQLYLDQLVDLSDAQKAFVERNIKSTIQRLNNFQLADGGLSYWPGGIDASDWGTDYAGHFMLAAQDKGYSLPIGFMERWKNFEKQKAQTWAPDVHNFYTGSDLEQAYRLYLLALDRAPELGAMNRLREFQYLSAEARWRLAAAYKLAGQPEIARQLVNGLPLTVKPYNAMYGSFGSDLRDEAMILETLNLLGQQQKAASQMRLVASRLSEDNWYSTQTTAYSLLAIAEYCGKTKSGAKLQFSYQSGTVKGAVTAGNYLWQQGVAANGGKVTMRNNGANKLYVRLIQSGQPTSGEDVKSAVNPAVLDMHVSYFTLNGKSLDPSKLKQGTDFVAKVTLQNPGTHGRYDNMALTQIFPSGWEILNSRLTGTDSVFTSSNYDYIDIRDDRVYTYFSLYDDKAVSYYIMLNAAYAGKYYMPATYCEAMYDHSISALIKGEWIEVEK
jgi:uncharacterized protein YfaS (alpha-2-macroglobulin family)